jgi:hypothetical protein
MAPFIDPYAALPGMMMRVRPVESVTIRPPSLMSGRSFWIRKKTPLKWMLYRRSSSSSVGTG